MRVDLRTLKPNPLRDFQIDPLDDGAIKLLKESIEEDGFWGGVVCRQVNGEIEVAAGWHRVTAAMAAGLIHADVFVGKLDDEDMVRVYARENATQRRAQGTATAGTIAAAIRYLVDTILQNDGEEGSHKIMGTFSIPELRGHLINGRGIGVDIIKAFLSKVPGINEPVVQAQITNLKESGNYARIITEVAAKIERDNADRLAALARAETERLRAEEQRQIAEEQRVEAQRQRDEAEKQRQEAKEEADRQAAAAEAVAAEERRVAAVAAAETATTAAATADQQITDLADVKQTRDTANAAVSNANSKGDRIFDLEGVSRHLHIDSHINAFRKKVTGAGIKPYLPVENQAQLAEQLVKKAEKEKVDVTAAFINDNIAALVLAVRQVERRLSKADQAALERTEWEDRVKKRQDNFSRNARGMLAAAVDLSELAKKRPKGTSFLATQEFRNAVDNVRRAITLIEKGVL